MRAYKKYTGVTQRLLKGIYLYLDFIGEDFQLFENWVKEISKAGNIKMPKKTGLGGEWKGKEPKFTVTGNATLRVFFFLLFFW